MKFNKEALDTPNVLPPKPPKEEKRPENQYTPHLTVISVVIVMIMMFGLSKVLPGEGAAYNLMILTLSFAMAYLAFIGNHAVIRKGTVLAARGETSALLVSMAWFAVAIGIVGTVSGTGASYDIVSASLYREAQQEVARVEGLGNQSATSGKVVLPVVRQAKADIERIIQGEITKGTVSGRPGRGPEVDKLETLAAKFDTLLRNFSRGGNRQEELTARLSTLAKTYEEELASGTSWASRRAKLIGIYSDAQRTVQELAQVAPTVAVTGLISQLRAYPAGTLCTRCIDVGATLKQHAAALETALPKGTVVDVTMKPFPSPPGLGAAWQALDETWPLVVFGYGLEVGALVIWWMVRFEYAAIYDAAKLRRERDDDEPPSGNTGVSRLPPEPDPEPIDLTPPRERGDGTGELPAPESVPDRRQLDVVSQQPGRQKS